MYEYEKNLEEEAEKVIEEQNIFEQTEATPSTQLEEHN